ncbi:chitinase [Streptomyces sp. HD1123-B1]|uniref:chitinase n=1 Tax=Streptomyces huangiella TaxID=3228804 RepID=UPI003D7E0BAA
MSTTHRRRVSRTSKVIGAVAAAAVAGCAAFALSGAANAGTVAEKKHSATKSAHQGAAKGKNAKGKKGKKDRKTPRAGARFAPYVDTSLSPAFNLVGAAKKTGVKEFSLAFITSGGGCTPTWGGATDLGGDGVARQIGALRKAGGDVRVSFGGASGSELGVACTSAEQLTAAYAKAVDTFKLTKVDFDIEGAALPDTTANTRRAKAIAALQKSHPGLDVSFTLPVMPTGLTQDGVKLVADAKKNGVKVSAVNIMAMDYGASFDGDMGRYAIEAATATQAQLKDALGLCDRAAWRTVVVTPMIGVNDVVTEVFTVDDARQLVDFARSKKLGGLSMWSATRDKACPGGPQNSASPTCSSVEQKEFAFSKALGAYRG